MDGDSLYVWQVYEEERWGTISAFMPAMNAHALLVTRNSRLAGTMRPLAQAHRDATGRPVRLARFDYAATREKLP